MMIWQELQPRAVNFTTNILNPPLGDLQFADELRETGFNTAVVNAMGSRTSLHHQPGYTKVPAVMPFDMAAKNASLLAESIKKATSKPISYKAGDTLEQVLGQCVSRRMLNAEWLPSNGYGNIGFG